MDENVPVGVSGQTEFGFDGYAAQHELCAVREPVRIVAMAYADHEDDPCVPCARNETTVAAARVASQW